MDWEKIVFDLCSVYSQTGHGGSEQIAQICQEVLLETELSRRPSASIGCGDDLLFSQKGSGQKRVLLLGHYDTVPAAGNRKPQKEGEKIVGLGTWDMKGGVALALSLMNFASRELSFKSLDLLLAGDEERRSSPFRSPGEYDAVISFEGGTAEGLVVSRFGAGVLEINLEGKSLRAEYPLPQPGSIDVLMELHSVLRLHNTPDVHFTSSVIEASSAINVVPGHGLLAGVLRYRREEDSSSYLEKITEVFHQFKLTYSFSEVLPPLFPSGETLKICDDLGVYGVTRIGASDISWMRDSARLLFDGLGPFGGLDHTPDEYILPASFPRQEKLGRELLGKILS